MTRVGGSWKVAARRKEAEMDGFFGTFLTFAFFFGTLAFVGWALFEMSPWARHKDQ